MPPRRFTHGLFAGAATLVAAAACIEQTPMADWAVAPLLRADSLQTSDAIVVLGAGVLEGCSPNTNAVRRTILATRLWKAGQAPLIVFTGGGQEGCTVAASMAALARELGVSAHALRMETASSSTWENGALTAPLLRGWRISRVLLVTDRLHMARAEAVFRGFGFDVRRAAVPIAEGHAGNLSMLAAGLREYVALAYYWSRGRLRGSAPAAVAAAARPVDLRPLGRGPLAVLGASYAEAWQPGTLAGLPVVVRGVTGQQSFEFLERFDADITPLRPRAVVIWGFINDLFRAPGGDMQAAAARVRASYVSLIARARERGIEPILATEVTIRPPAPTLLQRFAAVAGALRGKQSYQDRINIEVRALNDWLVDTATRERLLLLHFQSVLSEPGGQRHARFALPDGSHISVAGYAAITTYTRPILEEHFGVR